MPAIHRPSPLRAQRRDKGIVIDGEAQPLTAAQPPNPQGDPGAVQQPGFVIKGRHGDIRLPTIEQWRARFVAEMGKLTPDAAVPLLLAKARTSASSLL